MGISGHIHPAVGVGCRDGVCLAFGQANPWSTSEFESRTIWKLTLPYQPGNLLLSVWLPWDAVHHLHLAMSGYVDLPIGDSVSYPLLPILTRLFTPLLAANYVVGGLFVSTIATFISFTFLYLLAEKYFDPETAKWSVLVLATFPTSLFHVEPFTESLYLALTLGVFLAVGSRRWGYAGVLGFLASLVRGPGLLTPLALLPSALRS
jgi:Gpi18-like mannosyltransferase